MHWLTREVLRRGGLAEVRTEPGREFDRRTGQWLARGVWANRIVCRDGWERVLTNEEQRVLMEELPEDARALEHTVCGRVRGG